MSMFVEWEVQQVDKFVVELMLSVDFALFALT
jgi:hypothetical protein